MIAAFESSRQIQPGYNNWLLFLAMVEATLSFMGAWWDPMRVDYAICIMDTWYKGDGVYGDGLFSVSAKSNALNAPDMGAAYAQLVAPYQQSGNHNRVFGSSFVSGGRP